MPKKISCLATGNEIINGDVEDKNSGVFAKKICAEGGEIYQRIQVSDRTHEIIAALKYLLNASDAVIVTGGLGPTSDDNTRFAIADVTQKKLYFSEIAWEHIVKRFNRFNMQIPESNRQQALFPEGAALYLNENGSASGCHLEWQGKHIFMLPGPPKECQPLFEKYVMEKLEKEDFLHKKRIHRWLVLGLGEGEIAPKVDLLAKAFPVETAYRWDYPYLEIKLNVEEAMDVAPLILELDKLLGENLVSNTGLTAIEMLNAVLPHAPEIYLVDEITKGQLSEIIKHKNLHFVNQKEDNKISFVVSASHPVNEIIDIIEFKFVGYVKDQQRYLHQISIPNRGPEVMEYAKNYMAWQILKFLKSL